MSRSRISSRRRGRSGTERFDRLKSSVRAADLPIEAVATFLSLLANGLAFARTTGDELPDLDLLNELVETGVERR